MESRPGVSLLRPTDRGLYCEAGDFFVDPWTAVDRAVITHVHGDHVTWGCRQYLFVLANATSGGVHPWQLHRGQCGADEGVFGTAAAYQPATVDRDGRASATATIPLQTPTTGSYFVIVHTSAANAKTTVACGNLAPPTQ